MFIKIQQKKGVTLIELIVTLALISVVLVAVFNLFIFNRNVYTKSDELSQVQFDVRMASDMLTKNLRNVSSLSLTDNTLANEIGLSDLQSKYPSISSVNFTIVSESSRFLVEYTIVGNDATGDNLYTINSKVLLNNITSVIAGTGSTLFYE